MVNADLSVDLCGLKLEHPVMNGAGSCKTLEEVELLSRCGVSAIMVGSATVSKSDGNAGDTFYFDYEDGLGSINSVGLRNPGIEEYKRDLPKMIEIAHAAGKLLFFSGAGHHIDQWAELAIIANEAKVDLFEANFSCPNVDRYEIGVPQRLICFDIGSFDAYLRTIRRHFNGRISVKVSPYSDWCEIANMASIVRDRGADAVTICNSFPKAFMFRYGSKRPAVVPQMDGLGGYAGQGLRPIALGQVRQWRRALDHSKIPIIGVGGASKGRHVQEFLWCGASAVQVVTELLKKGKLDPAPIGQMLTDWVDVQAEGGLQ